MPQSMQSTVTIIISMYNSETTIVDCLKGITTQDYPINEIILFDNLSTDASVVRAKEFMASNTKPIRLVEQKINGGLALSNNTGAEMAQSEFIVLIHSDSLLPSTTELRKLVTVLEEDKNAVAACPNISMPKNIWLRFPYWQKFLFARDVMQERPSMCGKFDCIRCESFRQVGGSNAARFTATCGYGGEDADLAYRLRQAGKIINSSAKVVHLHNLGANYNLHSLFRTRKMLARTYGKIIQFQGPKPLKEKFPLFIKLLLAFCPIPPILLLVSFILSTRMYREKSTLFNWRIFLVPFVDVALIYYEAFWFIEGMISSAADSSPS
ncbi:MAG: glycosyltransferase [Kiritimatiellae bacterium]|jgi:GT2 family glycosyltransferase|nr:glycosyltransferase [Kiritimatiellia bacterium]